MKSAIIITVKTVIVDIPAKFTNNIFANGCERILTSSLEVPMFYDCSCAIPKANHKVAMFKMSGSQAECG